MAKLDKFMALLTDGFNNKEQCSSLQKAGRNFSYAEYINMAYNDKINNLLSDPPGKFMVEESICEVNGKRHASSHLFLFTEKPEGILLTSYEVPEDNNKAGSSYKNMTTADFLCLKLLERFTPALSREKSGVWEGGNISMSMSVTRFQLLKRFSKDCLEVSETTEVNGKRTFGYDQSILYKRVPEQTVIGKPYTVSPANCSPFLWRSSPCTCRTHL